MALQPCRLPQTSAAAPLALPTTRSQAPAAPVPAGPLLRPHQLHRLPRAHQTSAKRINPLSHSAHRPLSVRDPQRSLVLGPRLPATGTVPREDTSWSTSFLHGPGSPAPLAGPPRTLAAGAPHKGSNGGTQWARRSFQALSPPWKAAPTGRSSHKGTTIHLPGVTQRQGLLQFTPKRCRG